MIKLARIVGLIASIIFCQCGYAQSSPAQIIIAPDDGTGPYIGAAGLAAAIDAANAKPGPTSITLLAGHYRIDASHPLPAITGSKTTIQGEGRSVQISLACDPAVSGRVFTIRASFVDIRNLTIAYTPACSSYTTVPFGIESGADMNITNIALASPPGLAVIGTQSTAAARVTFRDITGPNWQSPLGLAAIDIVAGQELLFDNVVMAGGNPCTDSTRALRVTPASIVDTLMLRRVEIFTSAGCPRLVTIDFSNASVVYLWVQDSVFDASTIHGIEILSSGAKTTYAGHFRFSRTSVAALGGNSVFISLHDKAAVTKTLQFDHNLFIARAGPIIVLDPSSIGQARSILFDGNEINNATNGYTGASVAVSLGMDNFTFIANSNSAEENGPARAHPGSVFFKTTKPLANGIIQGNSASVATITLDTSAGAIHPSAVSGNLP